MTAFLGQHYKEGAERAFFENLFPQGGATPIGTVGDAVTGLTPGVEAMLDIEYMPAMGALNPTEVVVGLARSAPRLSPQSPPACAYPVLCLQFWGFSGRSPVSAADEPFLKWLTTVSNTSDAAVPLVFSTSYGEDEPSEVPTEYADRISAEFVKGGARGISFLFASGDSGYQPQMKYGAASPYVTAVGGIWNGELRDDVLQAREFMSYSLVVEHTHDN